MKTSELIGDALDWAVAKCVWPNEIGNTVPFHQDGSDYAPSRKWAHGGPIIEREKIGVGYDADMGWVGVDSDARYQNGLTPLVAAMRCFVASRLGDEIEIPAELS